MRRNQAMAWLLGLSLSVLLVFTTCAPASAGPLLADVTTAKNVGGLGGLGPYNYDCGTNGVVVGIAITPTDAGQWTSGFGIYCRTLGSTGQLPEAAPSPENSKLLKVMTTGSTDLFCPVGLAVVALKAATDGYVNGAGLQCAKPGSGDTSSVPVVGEGPIAETRCPVGGVAVGMRVALGSGIDSVAVRCRALALFSITYDIAGGDGAAPEVQRQATIGDPLTLADYTGSKPGFTFAGWAIQSSATPITAGSTFTPTQDVTLVAQWEAVPTPTPTSTPTPEPTASASATPGSPMPFDPTQDPEGTLNFFVGALALVAAFLTRGSNDDRGEKQRQELAEIKAAHLETLDRHSQWGDSSLTWRLPGGKAVEAFIAAGVRASGRVSTIIARTLADGAYLRAMAGSLYIVLPLLGAYVGFQAHASAGAAPIPPVSNWLLAVIAIAIADAFSGFVAAVVFVGFIVQHGSVDSIDHVLTLLGLSAIMFAPALLASAARSFRRRIETAEDVWERLTDYAIASLFGGWATANMIKGLGALSGLQFDILDHATEIGVWAAAFIVVRLLLEELAQWAYPERLRVVTPELPETWRFYRPVTLFTKTVIFVVLLIPYIGTGWELYAGTALFLAPTAISKFRHRFPTSRITAQFVPKATLQTLVMMFVGAIASNLLARVITDAEQMITLGFVLLSLPGLALALLAATGDSTHDASLWRSTPRGVVLYRVGGVAVYSALTAAALGVDITGWMFQ